MKPDEMRDDIPEDVREALADLDLLRTQVLDALDALVRVDTRLVSELIPWEYLDPRWQWAAMDSDGSWYVSQREPDAVTGKGEWSMPGGLTKLPIPDGAPVPWTQTKVKRPEGV